MNFYYLHTFKDSDVFVSKSKKKLYIQLNIGLDKKAPAYKRTPLSLAIGGIAGFFLWPFSFYKPIRFLSHYLRASGKKIVLTQKEIKNLHWSSLSCNDDGWYETSNPSWHHSVGKFRLRCSEKYIHVLDRYVFYPMCKTIEHNQSCDCLPEERRWSPLNLFKSFSIPHSYRVLIVSVEISDRFWTRFGRPFYTVGHYDKEERDV